jgi:hypothetical protein
MTDGNSNTVLESVDADKQASVYARGVTAQKRAEAELAERRAKELKRPAELKRCRELTVGRELKMIELKQEIAEMKKALEGKMQ